MLQAAKKCTRRDGSVYFLISSYYKGDWITFTEPKFDSFIDVVLYIRKQEMEETVTRKYVFGDINNA